VKTGHGPVLLVNQSFYSPGAATGQFLADLAHELAGEHAVSVICGDSRHAEADPLVNVVRVRIPKTRVASYLSFLCAAAWHALRMPRQDIVVTMTTPPLLALIGTMLAKLRGSRHYIWEMDVYPDIAEGLGVLGAGSPVTRMLAWIADYSRRRAAGIIALGECMKTRLIAHGIDAGKIHVVENWADGERITARAFPEGTALRVHYSGNLGLAHDVETIRGAMLALGGDARFEFIFAGGGPRRGELERCCREHETGNVRFESYCGRGELGDRLAEGHIGLVTQRAETLGSVVPSKTYGIMAAGRPVLFIGPREATPARIIREFGCGWQVECGDVRGVVDLLHFLEGRREEIYEAGGRARKAFEERYDRGIGVRRIAGILGEGRLLTRAVPNRRAVMGGRV
jgi:colanic acid biosynthesis glycosyl transferase WcaI